MAAAATAVPKGAASGLAGPTVALLAMLDAKSTRHVTVDLVTLPSSDDLLLYVRAVQAALANVPSIPISTDAKGLPAAVLARAQKASPGSFARTNANGTVTGFLGKHRVMLVSSPAIAALRAALGAFDAWRPALTKYGAYIPHTVIAKWTDATALPAGTSFDSRRIVLRQVGVGNLVELNLPLAA